MLDKNLANYFSNFTIALLMVLLYTFLASLLLPRGINSIFTLQAMVLILPILVLSSLIFILSSCLTKEKPLVYLTKNKSFFSLKEMEQLKLRDFILLLFPLTPITQYVILNSEIISITDSFLIILFFIFLILIFSYLIPWILSICASKEILTIVSLSFLFIIFNMATLSAYNSWHERGTFLVQIIFLTITTIFLLVINFISKKILIVAIISFFMINISLSALGMQTVEWRSPTKFGKFHIESVLKGQKIDKYNDVILLVFEAYSNNETMIHYGFDNIAHLNFLKQNGFHVYHGIYTLGIPTLPSMSFVFNVEQQFFDRSFVAGDGAVHRIFRKQKYKTFGIFQSDFFFRGLSYDKINYDLSFPAPAPREGADMLIHAILGGEFSDEVSLKGVGFNAYLKQKRKVLTKELSSPKFIYAHSPNPGHSPSMGMSLNEREKILSNHLIQIKKANREMREDIELLLKHNPEAIVIIAGDHGPFMTKTGYGVHLNPADYSPNDIDRYDIQDRFGAFLAIKWPEIDCANKFDIKILQDIFPAVLAYLYDDETLFEKTRIHKRTTAGKSVFGVNVEDGIIVGGKDDGRPLFKGIQ